MRRMLSFPLLAFALTGLLAPAPTIATVDRVVVYPDRASVTRVVEQRVGGDVDRIRIDDLPVGLDRDSLRVRAEGPDGLRIGALEFEIVRGKDRALPAARALEQEIAALETERAGIADRIAARDLQLNLLQRIVSPSSENGAAPAELMSQLNQLGEQADRVYGERRSLLERQAELNEMIQRAQRELADLGNQRRDALALEVAVAAPTAGSARFTVEYTTPGAFWRPVYAWRLNTETRRMAIVQSAEIRQSTGEDWQDAQIAVSLARPSSGGALPGLTPWWLDVQPPTPEVLNRQRMVSDAALEEMAMAAPASTAPAGYDRATLTGPALTQRYELTGRVRVPGDNTAHRFLLAEHALDVELTARAVPQRQAAAWTFVEAEWTGEAALPPGPVQLFQDGASMGRMNFGGVAPGGTLETSFGVDDRLEIEVELVRQDRRTEGLINKSIRELREYRWTVVNRHARPIPLTLLGQLPVARDSRIEVALTDRSDSPDRVDIDDQPGRVAWDLELAPGDSRSLTVGFSVTWPEDLPGVIGW